MARFISMRNPKQELEKAFKMYDYDDGGTISIDNLRDVAKELGQQVTEEELTLMLKLGDRDNKYNGEEVDKDDFMKIMVTANLYSEDGEPMQLPVPILTPQN